MYHLKTDVYHFRDGDYQGKKLADGTVSYTAQIRIKRDGV